MYLMYQDTTGRLLNLELQRFDGHVFALGYSHLLGDTSSYSEGLMYPIEECLRLGL
jgi:hypothetical protein